MSVPESGDEGARAVGPPWRRAQGGRFEQSVIESAALRNNSLGDPWVRPIEVYLPPGYDDHPEQRYPSVYMIQGYTGQLDMWHGRSAFRPNFPELCDALFSGEDAPPPVVVVFVDCWTSVGGSQFLNLPGDRDVPHPPLRGGGALGGRPATEPSPPPPTAG